MTLERVCVIKDLEAAMKLHDFIELDFLGYGAGRFKLLPGTWLPVLSNPMDQDSSIYEVRPEVDRLGRSIIFFKSRPELEEDGEDDDTVPKTTQEKRITSMAKAISAMVNGAWINDDYTRICKAVINRVEVLLGGEMKSQEIERELLEFFDPL